MIPWKNNMLSLWIGTAFLAGSWLFGLDFFYPANPWAWFATVAVAVFLLGNKMPLAASQTKLETITLLLLLPAVWYASWPYRAAPLLIVLGLAVRLLQMRTRWWNKLADGAVTAGVVMLAQGLALQLYASQTARSHELFWPLPEMMAGIANLLGMDATVSGSSVVIHSMRQVHRLGATWELLLDPATFLFYIGGATMLALRGNDEARMTNDEGCGIRHSSFVLRHSLRHSSFVLRYSYYAWSAWLREFRVLTFVMLAWLPLRAGLMMAVYLQRVLRSDPNRPLHAMNHLFSPWMLLLLLAPPAMLAWRFVSKAEGGGRRAEEELGTRNEELRTDCSSFLVPRSSFVLIALAVALLTVAVKWDPVGPRHEGRVMIVERHSTWEPTTTPYDTQSFGELSGYNYAAIYNYLGQYFQMSRLLEKDKIDEKTLANCDVLIIKNPSTRYSQKEIDAVQKFVEQGGGLLLLGDHTNFEGSGTILNDIARPMGFIFRDDLLFGFGESPYEEHYEPPAVPHPIVQNIPPMDFAVSCSIDPGHSRGRPAIANTGLWSMGPEYHFENYHPYPQHCPEMRYGAFIQVWAARFGQGRAVGFTDSTIFSNFCVFQPGKAELMLGMVEWLNHGPTPLNPRPWLLVLGLATLGVGLWMMKSLPSPDQPSVGARRGARGEGSGEALDANSVVASENALTLTLSQRERGQNEILSQKERGPSDVWLLLLSIGMCGWMVASLGVTAMHGWAMPVPECVRPMTRVVIDRSLSAVPLSKGADTQGDGNGYGLLEQWIARLGCYTVRQEGPGDFSGDALVIICPSRSVTPEFREQLTQYVADGGKLLVIDSTENIGSTADSLLNPFGMSIRHDRAWKGKLSGTTLWPTVDIDHANEVTGGQAAVKLEQIPIAATTEYEKGSVMAIGFGSLWNDARMGEHWMLDPDATVKGRYDVLFALLRSLLDDKPLPEPPAVKKPPVELPMKESGPAEM